jgi:hypothetical protein
VNTRRRRRRRRRRNIVVKLCSGNNLKRSKNAVKTS